jgi:hypothetical protein
MAAELTGADINEPAVLSHFFRERQTEGATNVAANAEATAALHH